MLKITVRIIRKIMKEAIRSRHTLEIILKIITPILVQVKRTTLTLLNKHTIMTGITLIIVKIEKN